MYECLSAHVRQADHVMLVSKIVLSVDEGDESWTLGGRFFALISRRSYRFDFAKFCGADDFVVWSVYLEPPFNQHSQLQRRTTFTTLARAHCRAHGSLLALTAISHPRRPVNRTPTPPSSVNAPLLRVETSNLTAAIALSSNGELPEDGEDWRGYALHSFQTLLVLICIPSFHSRAVVHYHIGIS